jgi:hypothetical protein
MTDFAAVMLTVHEAPDDESHPVQPTNVDPRAGAAVSVTLVPELKSAEHAPPQLMPAGDDETVPLPLPPLLTVSVKRCTAKLAVTVLDPLIVTLQTAPLVESHPLQLTKVDPASGAAVRETAVPLPYDAAQLEAFGPQLIPESADVTVPRPVPDLFTVSVDVGVVNVAVTDRDALIVTVQVVPDAVSQPFHAEKTEPLSVVAVSVTDVFVVNDAEHVDPQLIPDGLDVTLPLPLRTTVSCVV